ncbi:nucleotidyltransferase family protein [Pontibacter harenae]|uniref:nucleotidyltransferase family protein n=1 Tax=Pontibacter harenae TaxID=2894083 RepID=UPI001E60070C|nr:nucleotidyltransferase family protein [Pontibacter harenae]MCC9168563.1 nucleotidyltransferase family protein [Pontibacter harenae]
MTGLVILAAGASTRLGEPKQRLLFKEKTLLQHAVHTALASGCEPVVAVLGANAESIKAEIQDQPVAIVCNEAWAEGMASSIRCGLTNLLTTQPNLENCIFVVCDQPFMDATLLKTIVDTKAEAGRGIVASAYKNTLGTPVLFDKTYFSDLLSLKGQEGAKKLLFKYNNAVASVPFLLGAIDIDTAADYAALKAQQ